MLKVRDLVVLGSTGSIGVSALDVALRNKELVNVVALMAKGNNLDALIEQCRSFRPKYVFVDDVGKLDSLRRELDGSGIIVDGSDGFESAMELLRPDVVMSAISGIEGMRDSLIAAKYAKRLAIANKETIVCAWDFLRSICDLSGCEIVPVDSEHNSIWQIMRMFEDRSLISGVTITASGGPFLDYDGDFKDITVEMALDHPKWKMGVKNTIDSATLVNKGLELMEACLMFDIDESRVDAIVHRESIVHGIVNHKNGGSMMFASYPDMRLHIEDAVLCDEYGSVDPICDGIDMCKVGRLNFEEVNSNLYPSIDIARSAIKSGTRAMIAFNALNEVAVKLFLEEKIKFYHIFDIVGECLRYSNVIGEINEGSIVEAHSEIEREIRKQNNKNII
ncbi:1-deoxy-D-xylulose-5-phosphate reductoisomerase [Rickettsiales bacterium]|nr:1-deoxy-D-xylulose-5-phosphate reductoisomerase [Rickettsiales bacterium]